MPGLRQIAYPAPDQWIPSYNIQRSERHKFESGDMNSQQFRSPSIPFIASMQNAMCFCKIDLKLGRAINYVALHAAEERFVLLRMRWHGVAMSADSVAGSPEAITR
jgi:hypothetical protein